MSFRISILAVVLGVGAGCANSDGAAPPTGVVQQGLGCAEFMCGTNSPLIAEFGFWELNMPPALDVAGEPNNIGLQLTAFSKAGVHYVPRVNAGRLTASRTSTVYPYDTITLSGSGLVGGVLLISSKDRSFQLRVSEVSRVASWATPVRGGTAVLETYKLDWTEVKYGKPGEFRNVCKSPPSSEDPDTLGMTGALAFQTLLFEGDRIDAVKKLETTVDASWFNLGCAGSTLAKMALTGHTEGSRRAGTFDTSLSERQTMLKMLSGDYCGSGNAYTVAGQPLNWRDDHGTMKLAALQVQPPLPLVLEARWNDKGAACLDKPRVDVHPTPLSDSTFGPDVYDLIMSECTLPQCDDSSFEVDGYHLLSATP